MSDLLTRAIRDYDYQRLNSEIKRSMKRSAQNVVWLGFMLRNMMEKKLYLDWYNCFDSYLEEELHMDYSMANRFMNINRKYSLDGDSTDISPQYEDYSQGVLIEMLNMPPELEAKVTPDMTVRQVREIKKQAKQKSKPGPAIEEDKTVIDGEYREVAQEDPPAEEIATSQLEKHDEAWFVEQYIENHASQETVDKLFDICRSEKNNRDRAKALQKFLAPYGYSHAGSTEWGHTFRGFAIGIEFCCGKEIISMKYGRFVIELMKLMDKQEELAEQKPLSALGYPKSEYPEGSLIAGEGCGHKYECFCCAQICEIRGKDRYCVEAPMGNPFPCTTILEMKESGNMFPDGCQFVNQELAFHARGDNQPVPCCKECKEQCVYRCERAMKETTEESKLPDIEDELAIIRFILEEEKDKLNRFLEAGGIPEMTLFRQKTIVGALAGMVYELETPVEEIVQPELPILKNNDQRKEWLNNYKAWGLWYRDENIDVNYYKYDFTDGSRLVVAEYPQRFKYYPNSQEDEVYYHLLEKGKKGYQYTYDEAYRHTADSETYLVEYLKSLQKKEKEGKL